MDNLTGKNTSKPKTVRRKRYESTDQTRNFEKWVRKFKLENNFFFGSLIALDKKYSLGHVASWAAFSLIYSFILFASFDYQAPIAEGEIATSNIKSPISFTFEDLEATENKKISAKNQVLPVFRFDKREFDLSLDRIYDAFASFRRLQSEGLGPAELMQQKADFDKRIGYEIPERLFEWLIDNRFSPEISLALRTIIENWGSNYLADHPEKHFMTGQKKVSLLITHNGQRREEITVPVNQLRDIYKRRALEDELPAMLARFSKIDQSRLVNWAMNLVKPNVVYDEELTESRREAAVKGIQTVTVLVEKNQIIVNEGAIINDMHVRMFDHVRKAQNNEHRGALPIGAAIVFFLFIFVSSTLVSSFKNIERNLTHRTYLLFTVSLMSLLIWKILFFVYDASLVQKFGDVFPPDLLHLALPFVLPILIAGLLTRSPYLLIVYVIFNSISVSLLTGQNFATLVFSIIAGLAALRTIYYCSNRNDVYKAGFIAALCSGVCMMAFRIVNHPIEFFELSIWGTVLVAAVAGGVFSSILTILLVPVFEYFSGVTSNLKLLDLASMNHPILQELMVKAPGTYHHSMVVGSMCEAAAREIGANPLLNKVMGYFHDIGKMKHPTYFVENQRAGENPHDHISPNLSKTIIVAHVKDGIEMALKAKLGREIADGIRQHHGTTTVFYFYNRALQRAEHPELIKEADFQYPGPKPQFKESAILMLADSIEAAARSLEDPTAAKLDYLVESLVEKKFVAQQLDECDLNFEEVSLMKQAFYRILLGVYHHRVEYPDEHKGGDKKTTSSQTQKSSDSDGNKPDAAKLVNQ
ncbi:MAG: HDIG domain-containing protein [Bdellovibrionaceae bacterium]|nr:HDIG domain-containing protein [Pseudobdellovibrionaceae bacterium]